MRHYYVNILNDNLSSLQLMSNEVPNFYKLIDKRYLDHTRVKYKNYDKVKIELPMQALIIGKTGSMKTNLLLYLIQTISAWDKIILLCKKPDEPLYAYLIDSLERIGKKAHEQVIYVATTIDELPDLDDFSGSNTLLIADDQVYARIKKFKPNLESTGYVEEKMGSLVSILVNHTFSLQSLSEIIAALYL